MSFRVHREGELEYLTSDVLDGAAHCFSTRFGGVSKGALASLNLGTHRGDRPENVLENSRKKLESKHCDMICANSLKSAGAGFGTDTNIVTLITKNSEESLELMSKEQVAHKILDKLLAIVQP